MEASINTKGVTISITCDDSSRFFRFPNLNIDHFNMLVESIEQEIAKYILAQESEKSAKDLVEVRDVCNSCKKDVFVKAPDYVPNTILFCDECIPKTVEFARRGDKLDKAPKPRGSTTTLPSDPPPKERYSDVKITTSETGEKLCGRLKSRKGPKKYCTNVAVSKGMCKQHAAGVKRKTSPFL